MMKLSPDQERTRSALLEKIQREFSGISVPTSVALLGSGSVSYEEVADLAQTKLPESWTDLNPDLIQFHAHDLPFLSEEAFFYFFPAFLSESLKAIEDPDDPLLEFTLYSLQRPDEPAAAQIFDSRVAKFDLPQKTTLRLTLEWVEELFSTSPMKNLAESCLRDLGA